MRFLSQSRCELLWGSGEDGGSVGGGGNDGDGVGGEGGAGGESGAGDGGVGDGGCGDVGGEGPSTLWVENVGTSCLATVVYSQSRSELSMGSQLSICI